MHGPLATGQVRPRQLLHFGSLRPCKCISANEPQTVASILLHGRCPEAPTSPEITNGPPWQAVRTLVLQLLLSACKRPADSRPASDEVWLTSLLMTVFVEAGVVYAR